MRNSEWPWLSEVSSVVVDVANGEQPVSLGVFSTPGFVRAVDRNALAIDIPKSCGLHRAMSQPTRALDITLWCRNPNSSREVVRLEGVGSVGPACPSADPSVGDQVCLRMTAFTVTAQCEGVPQCSNVSEAA
ncbi:MAG: hypothetical protein ACKO1N_10475 [Erythrobacter sp.]